MEVGDGHFLQARAVAARARLARVMRPRRGFEIEELADLVEKDLRT
jgi:hypothetical protein